MSHAKPILSCLFLLVVACPVIAGERGLTESKGRNASHPAPFLRPEHPLFCSTPAAVEFDQEKALAGGVTASDAPGWPVTIDRPGLYRLTGNLLLTRSDSNPAIEIIANSVSLDLGGFEIHCDVCEDNRPVIEATSDFSNIEVTNGSIRGAPEGTYDGCSVIRLRGFGAQVSRMRMIDTPGPSLGPFCTLTDTQWSGGQCGGSVGTACRVHNVEAGGTNDGVLYGGDHVHVSSSIFSSGGNGAGLTLGDDASVFNVTAHGSVYDGIVVGANSTIKASRASNNGDCGIVIESGSVLHSVASDNIDCGIKTLGDVTVIGNTISRNIFMGLRASSTTGYAKNVISGNNDGCRGDVMPPCPMDPQVEGGIETGINICGEDTVCP